MAKQYTYKVREIAATPRTGRTLDSALSGGRSSGGDVFGGLAFAGYWSLITTDKDNNPLEETAQYIKTKYHALSEGDVVAYATSDHYRQLRYRLQHRILQTKLYRPTFVIQCRE